jgi:hypothetical protein
MGDMEWNRSSYSEYCIPVFSTSARPPRGGTGEVSFGLEAGVELEAERRGASDDVGILLPTAH